MADFLENAIVNNTISWVQRDTTNVQILLIDNSKLSSSYLYTSGTGIGKANSIYYTTGTLSATSSTLFDLYSLTRNVFGSILTTSLSGGSLKGLLIKNANTGTDQFITFSTTGANSLTSPFSNTGCNLYIYADASFGFSNKFGYSVTSGQRYFRLNNVNSTGISYEMTILGVEL